MVWIQARQAVQNIAADTRIRIVAESGVLWTRVALCGIAENTLSSGTVGIADDIVLRTNTSVVTELETDRTADASVALNAVYAVVYCAGNTNI